jgi:RimJ/RimL family protein N-acetyltransferase
MRIDLSMQGRGIGSATLQALPSWVAEHWPESHELILSVDEENAAARRAYAKAGFADHGIREQGRIGWVRYMSKAIGGLAGRT